MIISKLISAKLPQFFSTLRLEREGEYAGWFWIILGLAWLVRLPLLDGSFWLDEAAQALEVIRPLSQQLDIAADFQPPLFHLLLHFWQYGGHQEWWLRLVSLLAGVGSIAINMKTAERWQGKRASILVGLLLATSSLHVFFSQELRPYMLAVFWGSLSLDRYLDILWSDDASSKHSRFSLSWKLRWFTLVNILGALTSYVYLFWLFGLFLTTWLSQRSRAWLVTRSLAVTGIGFILWLPGLLDQLAASAVLRTAVPGWEAVVSLSQVKAIPLTLAKFIVGVVTVDLNWKDGLLVFFPFASAFYYVFKDWQSKRLIANSKTSTLLLIFVFPLVFAWLFSFWTPVITPKRVLFLLPVFYLTFAQLWQSKVTMRATVVFGLLLLINISGLIRYWTDVRLQREDWRQAVTFIEERFSPSNCVIVFGFDAPFAPWVWYQTEGLPTINTGFKPIVSEGDATKRLRDINRYDNVIVFDYLLDLSDPQKAIVKHLQADGYDETEVMDYAQLGFVRFFRRQKLYATQVTETESQ